MFCTKCGTQVPDGSAKFCPSCGASISAGPAQPSAASPQSPAPAAVPATPAPAKPMSSGVKIVLALVAVFVFLAIAVMGTCGYFAYRVRQKVEQAKAEYGENPTPANGRDVCSLLSKEEVSEATGATITDVHGSTVECTYASADNPAVFQDNVAWQGGAIAYKLSTSTATFGAGGQGVVKLSGIGDEAWTIAITGKEKEDLDREEKKDESGMLKGMMSIMGRAPLFFRKGDVMVTLNLTEATDPDAAKKALAIKIASRI